MVWNDDTTLYPTAAGNNVNDFIVQEDGRYDIQATMSLVNPAAGTADFRTNIDAQIEITRGGIDIFPGARISNNYIRKESGHDHSSIHISEIVELQAGDDISIRTVREAGAGTVNLDLPEPPPLHYQNQIVRPPDKTAKNLLKLCLGV